ncbi:MAG: DNA repair protein RecO [Coprothermobacterota bacterium]|nr:DNA repair protein RecO [Coprothermobacterota bacterium]
MPFVKAIGLVLRTQPWRENDKLVFLFTRERGRLLASARGGRRPQSHWGGALEPLTELDLLLYQKGDHLLITQWQILRSHCDLRAEMSLCGPALYLVELVGALLHEEDPHPQLYEELKGALAALSSGRSPTLVTNAFILKMLSLIGYWPSLEKCALCGRVVGGSLFYFSPPAGGVLCPVCRHLGGIPLTVPGEVLDQARQLLQASWETLPPLIRGSEELSDLLRLFLAAQLEKGYSAVQTFRAKMRQAERAIPSSSPSGSGRVGND